MRLIPVLLFVSSCLAATDLEEQVRSAIETARHNLKERSRLVKTSKDGIRHSHSQKASPEAQEQQVVGDLLQEVTKIMVANHGAPIIPQLEKINMEPLLKSSRKKRCAQHPVEPSCSKETDDCTNKKHIRSFSGVCNNLRFPSSGEALTPVRRLLGNASYADGIGAIRIKSTTGSILPSTREISNKLHSDKNSSLVDPATNHLHMQFGQFIAHDIISMPSSVGPNGETLDCSACNSSNATDNCAPISVPDGDSYFPRGSCIRFTRALNGQKELGQRTQINQNTHLLDLSAVYGSDECVAKSLRTFTGGELKVFTNNGYVLPPQAPNDTNCQSKDPYYCFLAGDFRNSLHPGLIPLHVVYIKEHNRIAKAIKAIQPGWPDERLFQEARRLLIARHQHHVYTEYLPKLLGQKTMDEFGLTSKTSGYFTGYSDSVIGSLSAEFSAAAFRFGHSQARDDHPRLTNDNRELASSIGLGTNIFYADSLYENNTGGTESMLEGMLQRPSMAVDRMFTFPIRNQLFEIRGRMASGMDLVAVNIMRGRDVGLHPYNEYRTLVGLPKAITFDDLLEQMDAARVQELKSVYASVDDIDLYTGLLMERPVNGALLGRTGAYIIAETFAALKKGDRFFYESKVDNTRGLTPEELSAIRATSLSKLICGVSPSMTLVAKEVFDLNSPRVRCDSLKDIDIEPFVSNGGLTSPPPSP